MSNDALDLAFARHVRQIGLITPEQVNAALQAQSKSTGLGKLISVAEAFVQLGLLTAAQGGQLGAKGPAARADGVAGRHAREEGRGAAGRRPAAGTLQADEEARRGRDGRRLSRARP